MQKLINIPLLETILVISSRSCKMKRIDQFLFYLCFFSTSTTLFGMQQPPAGITKQQPKKHQAEAVFYRYFFLNHSEEFHVKPMCHPIDDKQAIIFIEHEVADSNIDPFAQPFCTCLCYLRCKVGQEVEMRFFNTVPKELKKFDLVDSLIAKYNLSPLRPGLSPNLTPLTRAIRNDYERIQCIIGQTPKTPLIQLLTEKD